MLRRPAGDILIIHPGALGDVLQAVPALVGLRELDGVGRLSFAAQWHLARLLAGTRLVDEAISFDGLGLETLFSETDTAPSCQTRLGHFDAVVSWFGSRAHPFPERFRALVPNTLLAPPLPEGGSTVPVWKYLLRTLAPWGVRAPSRLAPLILPPAWRGEARETLSRLGWDDGRPVLFVHSGAGGESKRWPAENFARVVQEVVRNTGCQVLVHQGPADRQPVEQLLRLLDLPVLRLLEPPPGQLAGILREASGFLGGDSGVSHLAAAVSARAVILFPPTTRRRWAPWSPTASSLTMSGSRDGVETVAQTVLEDLAEAQRIR